MYTFLWPPPPPSSYHPLSHPPFSSISFGVCVFLIRLFLLLLLLLPLAPSLSRAGPAGYPLGTHLIVLSVSPQAPDRRHRSPSRPTPKPATRKHQYTRHISFIFVSISNNQSDRNVFFFSSPRHFGPIIDLSRWSQCPSPADGPILCPVFSHSFSLTLALSRQQHSNSDLKC